ncbi:MAG: SLBB domain-containing protein [Bacteroidales bacterium]|nr:SLBB domain-containing protein [Bacteroidales bacterium]
MNYNNWQISLKDSDRYDLNNIENYIKTSGFEALKKALSMNPDAIVESIKKSGLRGRGGAGFPTGMKQSFTKRSCDNCNQIYVVCNADEGEPGTFKDRYIMEKNPYIVIEGMTIAAYAVGATKGFIYIRGEYEKSIQSMQHAIMVCYQHNLLGQNILQGSFSFDLEIYIGAGSYLCGEELTLIESLEGKRGYPRIKPPFPAEKGLWNKPTLINNVETFSHIPFIITNGSEVYASIGTSESKGTKLFCVSGNVKQPGVYELPLGITLRELIYEVCGGMEANYEFKGALIGGAAGTFVDVTFLDVPLAYETLKEKGATLGSGAVMVLDNTTNLKGLLSNILEFFKHESCGKCVPCRIGTTILYEHSKNISNVDINWMLQQAEYMAKNSLCPLGQSPILPIKSFSKYFNN